ncbi:hypothetical protein SAMN04515656_104146 [Eubacterium aggregans]|uniref:Uncharacterized protein n=1 Tax=Eubacterium aggregans TaxID=81409 RepID=A0A1H3YXL5_9FIRM|nr:hypothetical protein [Eubacterium aggregans]SEA15941.1 hypothetical protein SAMN04515656_104146 [Eubacterium aggregans]
MQDTFTMDDLINRKNEADAQAVAAQIEAAADRVAPGVAEESLLKIRSLQASDLFLMTSIISNIGLKEFKDAFAAVDLSNVAKIGSPTESEFKEVGLGLLIEVADIVMTNLWKCETYINRLISRIYGVDIKDVPTLDPALYLEMIMGIVEDDKFMDFFKAASKLLDKIK